MIPALSEATIQGHATPQSFERGYDYYAGGAVVSVVRRGDTIAAQVEGSAYEPYMVEIQYDDGGIKYADCTCPYDWGGWCKHIVATALACLHDPETVQERPPLEEAIAALDREQLASLLLRVASHRADLADVIEQEVGRLEKTSDDAAAPESRPPQRRTTVRPESYRRQVRDILHSLDHMRASEAYWHVSDVVDSVRGVLAQARGFLEGGDADNALVILAAIIDEYVNNWYYLDDSDGYLGEFFYELGDALTEALLSADLTEQERGQWRQNLNGWAAEAADYGIDDAFASAQAAISMSPSQLAGLADGADVPEELVPALLSALERRGEYAKYLQVAAASGAVRLHAQMLVRLGRIVEAVTCALDRFQTAEDALALAQTLREQEALDAAVQVGEHGLTLAGPKGALAAWVRDLAEGLGRRDLALGAALIACREQPGLSAYQKVQTLAGDEWPHIREGLLDHLRQSHTIFAGGLTEIFLHEGLIDDAMALADRFAGYSTLEQVVDAAIAQRPDWAIRRSIQQAERIIEPGKAKHYHHAVEWLRRARDAYRAAGREDEWRAYVRTLRSEHGRKYKLMGMLERIM